MHTWPWICEKVAAKARLKWFVQRLAMLARRSCWSSTWSCLPISKLFFKLFFPENYFFRTSCEHNSYVRQMTQQCVNIKYHTPLLISNLTSRVLSLNCIVRNSRKLLKTKLYESWPQPYALKFKAGKVGPSLRFALILSTKHPQQTC